MGLYVVTMENFLPNSNAKHLLWLASVCRRDRLKTCVLIWMHAKPLSTTFWSKNCKCTHCQLFIFVLPARDDAMVWGLWYSQFLLLLFHLEIWFELRGPVSHGKCNVCVSFSHSLLCAYVINNCKTIKPYTCILCMILECVSKHGLCVLRQNIPTTETTNDNIWNSI